MRNSEKINRSSAVSIFGQYFLNRMAWDHVLGDEPGGPNVSELIALVRTTDIIDLALTFISARDCEVFQGECDGFVSQLRKCGVSTELCVWPGPSMDLIW